MWRGLADRRALVRATPKTPLKTPVQTLAKTFTPRTSLFEARRQRLARRSCHWFDAQPRAADRIAARPPRRAGLYSAAAAEVAAASRRRRGAGLSLLLWTVCSRVHHQFLSADCAPSSRRRRPLFNPMGFLNHFPNTTANT